MIVWNYPAKIRRTSGYGPCLRWLRAVASWLSAFGVACLSLTFENDIHHGAGICSSLCAFCALQLVVLARYASAIDWQRPLAYGYILFLLLGLLITGADLLAQRRLTRDHPSH